MSRKTKSVPQPKQARAKDTVSLVITEANKAIETGGESSVRVQEISAKTGVSIGSIYHHFGDRDGLIRATYVHKFSKTIRDDIFKVKEWMANMHSAKEIAAHYDEMIAFLVHHFSRQSASERTAIVGNSHGRPLLRQALAEVQNDLTNHLTEVMQLMKERNMLKSHLTPRAAAVMVLGMVFGRAIAHLDTDPVSDHEWNQAMLSAFSGLFVVEQQLPV